MRSGGAWSRWLCPTRRIRRLPRRIEFFQGTLDSSSEITDARIFDTTLRDGEQTPRTSFSYEDKREIAVLLDGMGTHVIEAGFPVNSDAEFEAVEIAHAPSVRGRCKNLSAPTGRRLSDSGTSTRPPPSWPIPTDLDRGRCCAGRLRTSRRP